MPSLAPSCSASTVISIPPDLDMISGRAGTPTVILDADEVTQEMAARLTIAFLGQILYKKGQVPFPIASLSRIMDRKPTETASRIAMDTKERRIEFLHSYDDLASHLRTTFVALSTALAKNENEYPISSVSSSRPSSTTEQNSRKLFPKTRRRPAKVHILLVLGPSPSTAKARYLLEIDEFRVEQFGEWEFSCCNRDHAGTEQHSSESEDEREDELTGSRESVSSTRVPTLPATPQRSPSEHLDEWESPCLSSSRASCYPPSVPSSPSGASLSDDEELSEGPIGSSEEPNPFILERHAEEASLHAGERLLYRALFAGDEGLGFGDEISPTQLHVLIRAPRRFTHPTWIPRQSLGSMLDRQVQSFLESESCLSGTKTTRPRNNAGCFGVKLRTIGVRVKCQGAREGAEVKPLCKIDSSNKDVKGVENEEDEKNSEEDELIWWSWDGKLIGFTE